MKCLINSYGWVLVSALLITACSSSKKTGATDTKKSNQEPSEVTLAEPAISEQAQPEIDNRIKMPKGNPHDTLFASMERTPCYGRCPTYTIKIWQSGYTTYEGIRFAEREGLYKTMLTKEELQKLVDKANAISYFKLQDEYDQQGVTDLPSTITSLKIEGKNKKIRNRYNGPAELREFERFIDELFQEKEWKVLRQGGADH